MKNTISPIRAALATAITMLASASLFANEAHHLSVLSVQAVQ